MAHHEGIWMEGKQTSTDLIAVLSERFDWSKSTIRNSLIAWWKGCLTEKSGKPDPALFDAGSEFRLEWLRRVKDRFAQKLSRCLKLDSGSDFALQILISCSRSLEERKQRLSKQSLAVHM